MKTKTRKITVIGTMWIALMLATGVAGAQAAKIAFVDTQGVLQGTAEGQQELGQMEQYMQQKQTEYDSRAQELNQLQQQYQTQQRTMNTDAIAQLELSIEQKQRELRRFQEDIEADLGQRQNALLQRMSAKVQTVIQKLAEQRSYDAVFLRDQTQVWIDPALDVTQAVIELYNQEYPVGGATPAPGAGN